MINGSWFGWSAGVDGQERARDNTRERISRLCLRHFGSLKWNTLFGLGWLEILILVLNPARVAVVVLALLRHAAWEFEMRRLANLDLVFSRRDLTTEGRREKDDIRRC